MTNGKYMGFYGSSTNRYTKRVVVDADSKVAAYKKTMAHFDPPADKRHRVYVSDCFTAAATHPSESK